MTPPSPDPPPARPSGPHAASAGGPPSAPSPAGQVPAFPSPAASSPPAAAPATIPALTSVRGLAAWWVALYHFHDALPAGVPVLVRAVLDRGALAVDLFFVLSGFVISLAHAAEFVRVRASLVRRFLLLRLARIYPLHVVMLGLFLVNPLAIRLLSAQARPGPRYDPAYFVESLFLVQNWGLSSMLAWNVPAWSISTEWFAYLLFPFLACALLRAATRPAPSPPPPAPPSAAAPVRPPPPPSERRWLPLAVAAALLVLLGLAARAAGGLCGEIERFGLLRCVLEFSLGLCVFRLWRATPPGTPRRRAAASCTAGCVLLLAAWIALDLPDGSVLPLGFALLVFALAERDAVVSRLLSVAALERLGALSYATYLCHYFVRDWVRFLLLPAGDAAPGRWLALGAYVLGTAALSVPLHHLVERPGRRLGRRWAARRQEGGHPP